MQDRIVVCDSCGRSFFKNSFKFHYDRCLDTSARRLDAERRMNRNFATVKSIQHTVFNKPRVNDLSTVKKEVPQFPKTQEKRIALEGMPQIRVATKLEHDDISLPLRKDYAAERRKFFASMRQEKRCMNANVPIELCLSESQKSRLQTEDATEDDLPTNADHRGEGHAESMSSHAADQLETNDVIRQSKPVSGHKAWVVDFSAGSGLPDPLPRQSASRHSMVCESKTVGQIDAMFDVEEYLDWKRANAPLIDEARLVDQPPPLVVVGGRDFGDSTENYVSNSRGSVIDKLGLKFSL